MKRVWVVSVGSAFLLAVLGFACGGKSGTDKGNNLGVPTLHRTVASSCVGVFAPAEPTNDLVPEQSTCGRHADCTEGVDGKCVTVGGSGRGMYHCVYNTCASDDDCDSGKVCECSTSSAARCLAIGNCQIDADCGENGKGYCSPSSSVDCSGYHPIDGYHCHTPSDTCLSDSDCTEPDYCNYDDYDGTWKCMTPEYNCAIG